MTTKTGGDNPSGAGLAPMPRQLPARQAPARQEPPLQALMLPARDCHQSRPRPVTPH